MVCMHNTEEQMTVLHNTRNSRPNLVGLAFPLLSQLCHALFSCFEDLSPDAPSLPEGPSPSC